MHKVNKLVTHAFSAHADDFLATQIALAILTPRDEQALPVFRVPHKEIEPYLNDPTAFVYDIGKEFNPEMNNFDHHQDKSLPCAAYLVAEHFGVRREIEIAYPAMKTINLSDTLGREKAARHYGLDEKTFRELTSDPTTISMIAYFASQEGLVDYALTDIMRATGHSIVTNAKSFLNNWIEMASFPIKTIEGTELTYVEFPKSFKPGMFDYLKENSVDIVVTPSSRTKDGAVFRRVSDGNGADFTRLRQFNKYRDYFTHNNGFMASSEGQPVKNVEQVIKHAFAL